MNKNPVLLTLISLLVSLNALMSQTLTVQGDSTINQDESKIYTISLQNNSGSILNDIVLNVDLSSMTDMVYANGTTSIRIDNGSPFCTSNPTISENILSWDIDDLCSSNFTLTNGSVLKVDFALKSGYTSKTGSFNTRVEYSISEETEIIQSIFDLEVNQGSLVISMTADGEFKEIGDNITWTITIKNNGSGVLHNIEVTDLLGDGFEYVSSNPAASNIGQTTTWNVAHEAGLAILNSGCQIQFTLTGKVVFDSNLTNKSDAKCDNNSYNSQTLGGSAFVSTGIILKSPSLSFSAPDVNMNNDYVDLSLNISNIGDGSARDIYLNVDFKDLTTVNNVSVGAFYNNSEKRFELTNPIASGESYNLSFRLSLDLSNWSGTKPSVTLLWEPEYNDLYGNTYYTGKELSNFVSRAGTSTLTSQISGNETANLGTTSNYTISSQFFEIENCGMAGNINISLSIPDGFTISDAAGGNWEPFGNGTGGEITWSSGSPFFNEIVKIKAPELSDKNLYYGTVQTLSLTSSVVDELGFTSNSSSEHELIIECDELITTTRTISSSIIARGDDVSYTTTYSFPNTILLSLNELTFYEYADSNQKFNGSLSVIFDGNDITGSVVVIDTTPSGDLILDFSSCDALPLQNKVLSISYNLTITEETLPADINKSFYSWSTLDLGSSIDQIKKAVEIIVLAPKITLSLSGLGPIINTGDIRSLNISIAQASFINPKDVKLVLSGSNYIIQNLNSIQASGSVIPVSITPDIDGNGNYIWNFGDLFTGASNSSVLSFDIQKRSGEDSSLSVTAYYDDYLNDNFFCNEMCFTNITENPILYNGKLILDSESSTNYADSELLEYNIYVINQGDGVSHNVWIDNVLGSSLEYISASVDNMTGVTINPNFDHEGSAINGCSFFINEMAAGEKRLITLNSKIIGNSNLTNNISVNSNILGVNCQETMTLSPNIEIVIPAVLASTNLSSSFIYGSGESSGYITIRNTGHVSLYNLQVKETIPNGMNYKIGSSKWSLNGVDKGVCGNPTIATTNLTWTSNEISDLSELKTDETIIISFSIVTSDCSFAGGEILVNIRYEDFAGNIFNAPENSYSISTVPPQLSVTISNDDNPVGANQPVNWIIKLKNSSGFDLPIIYAEDILGGAFTYVSHNWESPFDGTAMYQNDQKLYWEFIDFLDGATAILNITANSDYQPASPDLSNQMNIWCGRGIADGAPNTKPGEEIGTSLNNIPVTAIKTETRKPELIFSDIVFNPTSINTSNDETEVTILLQNSGSVDAMDIDIEVTLPTGLTFVDDSAQSGSGTDQNDGIAGFSDINNPVITDQKLTFFDVSDNGIDAVDLIQSSGGSDTFVLRFKVNSSEYQTGNLNFKTYFYDYSELEQHSIETTESLLGIPQPEISVEGNKTVIQDGATSPSPMDYTDFGDVYVADASILNTFTIKNTGNEVLTLGENSVSFSAGQIADFSILQQPANSVAIGDSTTFTVQFNPSALGIRSTTIIISNNDSDENPYNFKIQGTGINFTPIVIAPIIPESSMEDIIIDLDDNFGVTDADNDDQIIAFTITGGTLTLGTEGITFGGNGNGSSSFTASGTLVNINLSLDSAIFTPANNLNGTNVCKIEFSAYDGKSTSEPAAVTFSLVAVNDPPVNTIIPTIILPGSIRIGETIRGTTGTWNDAVDNQINEKRK
ncbi:MAG: DUF11 domain-containing protein [Candidatus Delongbacteria bacterium]|nr:DUF11 domain-containing protein [Candidatus Delongbacteria bacterium]